MLESLRYGPPIISIDVEDWCQSTWDRSLPISQRSALNTERMLELLAEHRVTATLFVLGKFADAHPGVVRSIQQAGHEVGCHGHGHVEIFKQSRSEFAEDVRRAKRRLEDIIGAPVLGYRAPDFSVVRSTLWALDILAEEGFEYDSSIFPVRHSRYGIPDWPRDPARVRLSGGLKIAELPIATWSVLGRNLPVGGGGYHRLLPGRAARFAARRVLRDTPFVFYCHPYELDHRETWESKLPIPLRVRLHQGLGRDRFAGRMKAFLAEFGGRSMRAALDVTTLPEMDLRAWSGGQDRPFDAAPTAGSFG